MDLQLVFLGTAGATPTVDRGSPATLIIRGGERILVDCGEGTQRQLMRSVGLAHIGTDPHHPPARRPLSGPARLPQDAEPCRPGGASAALRPRRSVRAAAGRGADHRAAEVPVPGGGGAAGHRLRDAGLRGEGRRDRARHARAGLVPGGDARGWGCSIRRRRWSWASRRVPTSAGCRGERPSPPRTAGSSSPPTSWTRPRLGPEDRHHRGHPAHARPSSSWPGGRRSWCTIRPSPETEQDRAFETGHSTAKEAAEVARAAGVATLVLTHLSSRHSWRELRDEARQVFPGALLPRDLDMLVVPYPGQRHRAPRTGIMAASPASRGRRAFHPAHVAQGIEHWPPEPGVAGSNPAVGTSSPSRDSSEVVRHSPQLSEPPAEYL